MTDIAIGQIELAGLVSGPVGVFIEAIRRPAGTGDNREGTAAVRAAIQRAAIDRSGENDLIREGGAQRGGNEACYAFSGKLTADRNPAGPSIGGQKAADCWTIIPAA